MVRAEGDENSSDGDNGNTEGDDTAPDSITDTVDTNIEPDFNFKDYDFTFGVFENVPGIKYLFTLSGPVTFVQGFLNGTQMLKEEQMFICDRLIATDLIGTTE